MRVAVDGLPLLGEASIGTYLRELVHHIAALEREHEYLLVFRGFRAGTRKRVARFLATQEFSQFRSRTTRIPDRLLEWCWTHRSIHIPATEAWLDHPDLFLSTIYVTPVFRGVPVVMIGYDLIPMLFPHLYGQDQQLLATRIRRGIERASAIIAISERTKRDFVELMGADPTRVHVVYPAVDSRFQPQTDPGARDMVLERHGIRRPYLLYVGSFGPHKNVRTLVKAFRQLKKSRPLPHHLVLCGKIAWGPEVLEEAKDLVAARDCVILDFLPGTDIPALYQGADAFAFLSLYEGFGLPPLEAMACGVPVVVSNAGSLPEVVADAGLQVPPTDMAAIEEALYRVLTSASLREDLRARGLRQAARFSWHKTASETLTVFEVALRGH